MVTDHITINRIKAASDIAQAFAPSRNPTSNVGDEAERKLYASACKFLTAQFDNHESESASGQPDTRTFRNSPAGGGGGEDTRKS